MLGSGGVHVSGGYMTVHAYVEATCVHICGGYMTLHVCGGYMTVHVRVEAT